MPDSNIQRLQSVVERLERKVDILLKEKRREIKADKWVPEEEALKLLGISKKYLREQVRKGDLPLIYKKRNSHHYQYDRASLNRILNEV